MRLSSRTSRILIWYEKLKSDDFSILWIISSASKTWKSDKQQKSVFFSPIYIDIRIHLNFLCVTEQGRCCMFPVCDRKYLRVFGCRNAIDINFDCNRPPKKKNIQKKNASATFKQIFSLFLESQQLNRDFHFFLWTSIETQTFIAHKRKISVFCMRINVCGFWFCLHYLYHLLTKWLKKIVNT